MKTNKIVAGIIIILFLSVLFIIIDLYSSYNSYSNLRYKQYRTFLSKELLTYYNFYYTYPKEVSSFYDFIVDETDTAGKSDFIEILENEIAELTIEYVPQKNLVAIYKNGFDNIDNHLSSNIIDYDSLSFFEYLLKPKGDIIIAWTTVFNICDTEHYFLEYFKVGKNIRTYKIDMILDSINSKLHIYLNKKVISINKIDLLYKFRFGKRNENSSSEIVCNWFNTDTELTNIIQKKLFYLMSESQLYIEIDSIYFPVLYRRD